MKIFNGRGSMTCSFTNLNGLLEDDNKNTGKRENKALYLNGSSYGTRGNLSSLGIEKSFTVEGWINLPIGYSSAKLPFVCSNSSDFCVYIENWNLHTQIGSRIVSGSTVLPANDWTHIASVYNAQEKSVTLYVNGVNGLDVQITDATEIVWDGNMALYLGSDLVHYMQNVKVDDVRIYNIQIPGSDLDLYWQTVGMEREQSKQIMAAHYNMNNQTEPSIIMDLGQRNIDMIMTGSPFFVESTTDYSRNPDIIFTTTKKQLTILKNTHVLYINTTISMIYNKQQSFCIMFLKLSSLYLFCRRFCSFSVKGRSQGKHFGVNSANSI
ncbi:uncharacterized protein LOC134692335 [Mytilus trossulus]|uniref:uncharacterized protein LOC134692335 n=1 Tax=Mytilus trossulus TaxID=6551 RepID=UPI003003F57D